MIVEAAFGVADIAVDYEEVDYSDDSPTRPRLLQFNPLAQVVVEGLVHHARQLLTQLHALDHPGHRQLQGG